MCSKTAVAASFLILGLFSSSGCGLKFGETPSLASSVEFGAGSAACLRGGDRVLIELFNGKSDEKEVARIWECADESLQVFGERTRGKKPGVYQPSELREFFETRFLKMPISDRLLGEVMEVKRALVGGTSEVLTRDELKQARRILQVLKDQSLRLRPFFPLNPDAYSTGPAEARLRGAREAMITAAQALGGVLKSTGYDYSFSRLDALLDELQKMASTPEVAQSIQKVRARIPLFRSMKAALVAPDSDHIGGDEWVQLLSSLSRGYGLFLKFSMERTRRPTEFHVFLGTQREAIVEVLGGLLDLLDEVAQRYPGGAIPLSVFDELIDQVDPSHFQLGGSKIPPEHLKALLRTLVLRYLRTQESPEFLTRAKLTQARAWLGEWSEGQRFVDLLFERAGGKSHFASELPRRVLLAVDVSDISSAVVTGLRKQISERRPFFTKDEEITFVPADAVASDPVFSYRDLTFLNFMHLVSKVVVSGYSADPSSLMLSEEELGVAYFDLRDLGVDLRIFDPEKRKIYKKRFLEANLFTYAGNGDGWLDLDETTQLLAYMYSSKVQAKRAHDLIASRCNPAGAPEDFFGQQLIAPNCYRKEYFGNREFIWNHVPEFRKYYEGLRGRAKIEFERNLEQVARTHGYSDELVDSSDSEALSGIAHYVETLFLKYDLNRDGILSEQEVLGGEDAPFRVFRKTLEVASCEAGSCLSDPEDLQDLFTYLLYHGKVPGIAAFGVWKLSRAVGRLWGADHLEADRGMIVKIMAALSSALISNQGIR